MLLTPAQKIIARDLHRFRVVNCGRRFGKTTLAVEEMKGKALGKPSRIAYIANTYQQARDIAWTQLKRELAPITLDVNESRLEIRVRTFRNEGESLIVLRGWESIDTLRGQSFDFLVLDEVASMRDFWVNWEEVIRPTLTDRTGEALFISTPKGFNHFYELFQMENEDTDYKSFQFNSYDNPHLPIEELDKARKEITEDRFAQEYMADFRKTEGLVYKEFDRSKHLFDPILDPPITRELILGVDFGFTNPCAVVSIGRDGDDNFYILDEYYQTGKTDAEIAEYVSALEANRVYPDPENPAAITELRRRRVSVREVVKGRDSVKNGINRVRDLFSSGRLKVSKHCKNLIFELETYSYPDKKDQRNDDENPIKENDHAMDAMRYALSMATSTNGQAHIFYPGIKPATTLIGPSFLTQQAARYTGGGNVVMTKGATIHYPKLKR